MTGDGRVVVVVGAGDVVGRAVTAAFAGDGYTVVAVDGSPTAVGLASSAARETGGDVLPFIAEISSFDDLAGVAASVARDHALVTRSSTATSASIGRDFATRR